MILHAAKQDRRAYGRALNSTGRQDHRPAPQRPSTVVVSGLSQCWLYRIVDVVDERCVRQHPNTHALQTVVSDSVCDGDSGLDMQVRSFRG